MCDTLCAIGGGRTLFAKNSDRPPTEIQLVEAHGRRVAGGRLRVQYLDLDDPGAVAVVGSRPDWLWGFEHGVNEHGVSVGNEQIYTAEDASAAAPALLGMDLVRLGLERSENAEAALAVMTDLLERYGQGGIGNRAFEVAYYSSFLVADAEEAWILETCGCTWAAKRVEDAAAISNRISIRDDWDRASSDLEPGEDFDRFRDPSAPTDHADVRLEASRGCLATGASELGPRDLAAHLRHHGDRAWGVPGAGPGDVSAIPDAEVSVCMHVRGVVNSTAGMVCELPRDPAAPLRAWAALGNPCCSVFVPVFPPDGVPPELGEPEAWKRFAVLRDRAEGDPGALEGIRASLAPLEAELWDEADEVAGDLQAQGRFVRSVWPRLEDALDGLD